MESDSGAATAANPDVLAFYKELPFNYRQSAADQAKAIRKTNAIASYPVLVPLINRNTTVLDVGCGAGWFSLNAAYHCRSTVTGIDFNNVAVERAQEVARHLKVAVDFQVADLFRFEPPQRYALVASFGVLHHTNDCHAAIRRLCDRFVEPRGHVFLGLYHRHGRRPFLDHFAGMKAAGASEEEMLARYGRLHPAITDRTHLVSWFRDQVLHPHETQHTLAELLPLFAGSGMSVVATSLNNFAPIKDMDSVLRSEEKLEQVGIERLLRDEYYPGFFLVLAQKL
jgi:2-polyprenyl-3-methyl-5-hydroxy-6-metoxy-1,4-benzoquinol methylase